MSREESSDVREAKWMRFFPVQMVHRTKYEMGLRYAIHMIIEIRDKNTRNMIANMPRYRRQ